MSMVTMSEVAAKAGVSQATVSFVLGGRSDSLKISRQTCERVLGAARDLGYQRNQLARAMVTGKSRIIGVLTTPKSSDNMVRILTGAMEVASQNDYLLKVVHLSYNGIDDATIARCLEWRLAGAMIVGLSEEAHIRLNEAFHRSAIPVTLVDNVPQINWGVRISSDDAQGMHEVVGHLVGLGHSRIAYIGGRPGSLSEWRGKSFVESMADAGLSAPRHWIRNSSWGDQKLIESEVRALFEESGMETPTAVVCAADTIAMVVLRIARARGMRLPEDLSVTGYSNASLSDFTDPPLTTVDQSFDAMGRAAAQRIVDLAENHEEDPAAAPTATLLPTRLILRGSTAPPRHD